MVECVCPSNGWVPRTVGFSEISSGRQDKAQPAMFVLYSVLDVHTSRWVQQCKKGLLKDAWLHRSPLLPLQRGKWSGSCSAPCRDFRACHSWRPLCPWQFVILERGTGSQPEGEVGERAVRSQRCIIVHFSVCSPLSPPIPSTPRRHTLSTLPLTRAV